MSGEGYESATFGGGCFWCLDAVYRQIDGVLKVESGYAGGASANPTYREVCAGTTGHAEVVQITYNPAVVSYGDLLDVFFTIHDPTTLNRQGNDVGAQYRSIVLYHDAEQKRAAEAAIAALNADKLWGKPLVTEVAALDKFYVAEDYHQDYYKYNAAQPYCRVVIAPKVAKARQKFLGRLIKG